MTWKPDPRTELRFGPYVLTSERDGQETAHLVAFPDGREVRVLPDGRNSGQRRSRVTSEALTTLHELWQGQHFSDDAPAIDPVAYLVGCFAVAGLTWELVLPEVTIGEWLDGWFNWPGDRLSLDTRDMSRALLYDLDTAGWQIVRKDTN
jgi:hypothetical protein